MSAATEIDALMPELHNRKRHPAPLVYFLAFVFVLFIGILIFCYAVTRRAHPIFLDSHGKPVAEGPEHSHY
jgi:hypothetical protein